MGALADAMQLTTPFLFAALLLVTVAFTVNLIPRDEATARAPQKRSLR